MEAVKDVSERMKTVNLHEAEKAMKGNAGEALDSVERNLFGWSLEKRCRNLSYSVIVYLARPGEREE
jgi:hypothetical protein